VAWRQIHVVSAVASEPTVALSVLPYGAFKLLGGQRRLTAGGLSVDGLRRGELWRLATGPFVAVNGWHFLLNAAGVLKIGTRIANLCGWRLLRGTYVTSAVLGGLAVALGPEGSMASSSAGILGLGGATFALGFRIQDGLAWRQRLHVDAVIDCARLLLLLRWATHRGDVGRVDCVRCELRCRGVDGPMAAYAAGVFAATGGCQRNPRPPLLGRHLIERADTGRTVRS
jgi:membrane associated rhomboid family serine protease